MTVFDVAAAAETARCWLFTPGTKPDHFERAGQVGADAVILDLEDSVRPTDKSAARSAVFDYVKATGPGGLLRAVRVNPLSTATGLADLAEMLSAGVEPDVLVLPKTEALSEVEIVRRLLDEANLRTQIMPLIESARGVRDVALILGSTDRIAAVLVGAADLAADLGAESDWDSLSVARGAIVVAAACARVTLVDSPYFDPSDPAGLEHDTRRAARMGFDAKAAIHPGQIATINSAFTPTEEQIEWAHRVMKVNEAGVGTVDGAMVDEAVARRARRYLRRAR